MRSTLVITALVLVATSVAGCRPYQGPPAGAEGVEPGHLLVRAVLRSREAGRPVVGLLERRSGYTFR